MKILTWRIAYLFAGVLHFIGVSSIRAAERLDKRLTDSFRKLW